MAKSAAGKWVSRVGASGGGKAYKKTRPGNYYGALAVIVVLGLASTIFARYDYRHPASASGGTPPAVGTTWYGALSVQACGTFLPYLGADPTSSGGFSVLSTNVIKIHPVSAADSGNNATLSQFAAEYPGLIASSTELAIPTVGGTANAATTYRNGDTCPKGSKFAGQAGKISYAYWKVNQKTPTITTNPASIKFSPYLEVAMVFNPAGVTPAKPSTATYTAMYVAAQTGPTTTTAATPTTFAPTTTVGPVTTTSTIPTTSTTAKSTTTTAPQG